METLKSRRVTSPKVKEPPPGLWSNCKVYGNHVHVSGMVALDGDTVIGLADPYRQATYCFDCIKAYLEAAGGQMNDLIKMTIFITDIRDRPQVLEARRQFFTGDFPCSTLVAVSSLIDPRLLVEIEAVGFIGSSS